YLNVVDQQILAITAARISYVRRNDTFNLVWQPRFTPGRTPLIDQRWTFVPVAFNQTSLKDKSAVYPGRTSFGARWSHIGAGYEYSLSYYNGFNYLPVFNVKAGSTSSRISFLRAYPALRLYGGDAAVPFSFFTLKAEAAYYTSPG